jgi:hypothetical protein
VGGQEAPALFDGIGELLHDLTKWLRDPIICLICVLARASSALVHLL